MKTNVTLQMSTGDWITDERTGKQYMIQDTHDLVYDHIQQRCDNLGGFLPEPRDEQENQFLDWLDTDMFALGMTDRKVEGQWVWESDGSPVTWTNWVYWPKYREIEPNGGTYQNCALMLRYSETWADGHKHDGWGDYPCNSSDVVRREKRSLICQKGMWT